MTRVVPVILSGGAGTRLWPLSSAERPKQFHRLAGPHSLLQATALRVADPELFAAPLVIASEAHAEAVQVQLAEVEAVAARLILEPVGRNTAPRSPSPRWPRQRTRCCWCCQATMSSPTPPVP